MGRGGVITEMSSAGVVGDGIMRSDGMRVLHCNALLMAPLVAFA